MTQLMGILNVTPDSFFDGGRYRELPQALQRAREMLQEGADWIDIGGESTRPQAAPVELQEELHRVLPVIEALHAETSVPLSIDTMKAEVARQAVRAGASMINDVSGFRDPEMIRVAAECEADLCLMHMQGNPHTMQAAPHYEEGVVTHLLHWFEEKTTQLIAQGIAAKRIILDPGFGFGKSVAHNVAILQNLHRFKTLGFRLLVGLSRKSFMAKLLKQEQRSLAATLAANTMSLWQGVDILRVHDVAVHRDVIDFVESLGHFMA